MFIAEVPMKNQERKSHDNEPCHNFSCPCQNFHKHGTLHYLQKREVDSTFRRPSSLANYYSSHCMPWLFQETELSLGTMNKVFTSQWFSDRHIVFGTKCNKLFVVDITTNQLVNIPLLQSSDTSIAPEIPCGIHSIALNPSQTLLATGGENTNDLAIYRLPTFDPVCLGEGAHSDWIFDAVWLDDQYVISGSRDTTLALWNVSDCLENKPTEKGDDDLPVYSVQKPIAVESCDKAEKIRSLAFNKQTQEIVALSLNSYIHTFDVCSLRQKSFEKLEYCMENVCLAMPNDCSIYAVGSKSHVSFIDPRTLTACNIVPSLERNCGIRSVSFNGGIVTIGTGLGDVLFYDIRTNKYLNCICGKMCCLKANKGYLLHDDIYQGLFHNQDIPHAIYTHSYDSTGTKLFTAGGPLPAGLYGNYAALWE